MNHQEVREFCEQRGIQALANPSRFTPTVKPEFQFRKEHVIELVGFWMLGEIAMMLRGPSGCGKTALVEQFHAAMNFPSNNLTRNNFNNSYLALLIFYVQLFMANIFA